MHLALLETGGTINGILAPDQPAPAASLVLGWLEDNRERFQLQVTPHIVVMKDSRALTGEDRGALAAAIESSDQGCVLIPHGTYTMPETGRYLSATLSDAALSNSIVLVGSLVPLLEPRSDAPGNLEVALNAMAGGRKGVWLAMGGALWCPDDVEKDLRTGAYRARSGE